MQRASDRWISIALSLVLHGALLAALVYGWWMFREQRHAAPTPPIAATVVDARTLKGLEQPTPEERAQREQAEQARHQAQEPKAAEERAAEEKAAAEKAVAEKAAADRAAAARAAAEKAAAKAAAERARQEEQDRKEREADLKRSLAAEQADVTRNGAALASWESMIAAAITRAWHRPPTAKAGIDCILNVTQVVGGEVTHVSIGECNGDAAVRQSIEDAVYRASPLPPPPDPSLFDRNLKIRFKPD